MAKTEKSYDTTYFVCGSQYEVSKIHSLLYALKEKWRQDKERFTSVEQKRKCVRFLKTVTEFNYGPSVYGKGLVGVKVKTQGPPEHSLFEAVIFAATKRKLWYAYKTICVEDRYFHTNDVNHVFFSGGYVMCFDDDCFEDELPLGKVLCIAEEELKTPDGWTRLVSYPTELLTIAGVNECARNRTGSDMVYAYTYDADGAESVRNREMFEEYVDVFADFIKNTGGRLYNNRSGLFAVPEFSGDAGSSKTGVRIQNGDCIRGIGYSYVDPKLADRYRQEYGSVDTGKNRNPADNGKVAPIRSEEDIRTFFRSVLNLKDIDGWVVD